MRDVKPFLKHILEECKLILKATEGKKFEEFVSDEILKRAILRSLEVIGEAAKMYLRISEGDMSIYPGNNWRV